jgi:hypothetical protein
MTEANKAIERERHITPTLDDILSDLDGAMVFSALDLAHGYHQLELDEESRFITTFSTHVGLWRYKRLFFGVNSAAEVFQNAIRQTLAGLEGAINVSDDILVWGRSMEEHDRRLKAVLSRLDQVNITLNEAKCRFRQAKIRFYGFVFSQEGIQADPEKVAAVISLDTPESCDAVRSFLGMANYVRRFIPGFADITAPLRELTKKDATFQWTADCEASVNSIKELLANEPVLAYFNTRIPSEIIVDASPVGLAAILVQRYENDVSRIIAFASKSLSATEQRYSQLEREALAVLWGCQYFHIYIFGKPVTVLSDHKPLVAIFNNSISHRNTRLERWNLKLAPYNATIKHIPGATNPADYLSRHPMDIGHDTVATKTAEQHVNFITASSIPKSMTLSEVQEASEADPEIQAVIKAVTSQNWTTLKTSAYFKCREQLAVNTDRKTITKNSKLCIPKALQAKAIQLAHQGHQGLSKTKELIRSKIWFPNINQSVEKAILSCLPCQACTKSHNKEPVVMSPMPSGPWTNLSMDFYTLPTNEEVFVVIDDYSRYPEIHHVTSTSARSTMTCLERIFAQHGIPDVIRADNGPPFNGSEFAMYMKKMGIKLRKVTPVWAPANGEVERIMQPITKMVQTTTVEGRNWKDGLERFLLSYRATPHTVTGFSPAKLLFNRELKILLPEVPQENADHLGDHHRQARINDGEAKRKIADYANDNRNRKPSTLQVGDTVLLRNDKKLKNKMAPAFFPQPLTITKTKGSMITASSKNKIITRNSSFFKPFNCGDPVTLDSDAVQAPIPPALQIPHHQPPPEADDVPEDERDAQQPPAYPGNEAIEADNFPPITSDEEEDEPQNPGPPERRGSRPRRRPDPLHYVGKGIQGKKQDNN